MKPLSQLLVFGGVALTFLFFSTAVAAQPTTQPTEPTTQPVEPTTEEPTTQPTVADDSEESKTTDENEEKAEANTLFLKPGFVLAIDPELIPQTMVPGTTQRTVIRPKKNGTLDYFAWVPRIIFFPLHLVLEYGVRLPLEVATEFVERENVIDRVIAWTTFDDGNGSILPRFSIRSGFRPSFGLSVAWDNAFVEGNDYAIGADIGVGSLTLDAQTRVRFWEDALSVTLSYQFAQRSDFIFHGVGARTTDADEAVFARDKHSGKLDVEIARLASGLGANVAFEIADYEFDCGDDEEDICGADGTAGNADDRFVLSDVSAFSSGYTMLRMKGRAYWDSRKERPANGTGVRFDVFGQVGEGLNDQPIDHLRYGAEGALFWDFYKQRVLGMRLYSEFAEPTGDNAVPFGELVTLGGLETMRGFSFARFHGASAIVATFDYRYPIWSFLDANLFLEFGNTFDSHLSDFSFGALRPSAGLSIKTIESRYNTFDVTLALGGFELDNKFGVDSINVGFGTNWGF